MRKLYEINKSIEDLLNALTDPETGEIVDPDALEDLFMERDQKIESVVLYCKDVHSEWVAISHEIMALQQRADRLENTEKSLKVYLYGALGGEKFTTPKCEVSFRKSESVEVDDDFLQWAKENFAAHLILHRETFVPNKTEIKKYLKEGKQLEHCRIVEKKNIQVR